MIYGDFEYEQFLFLDSLTVGSVIQIGRGADRQHRNRYRLDIRVDETGRQPAVLVSEVSESYARVIGHGRLLGSYVEIGGLGELEEGVIVQGSPLLLDTGGGIDRLSPPRGQIILRPPICLPFQNI